MFGLLRDRTVFAVFTVVDKASEATETAEAEEGSEPSSAAIYRRERTSTCHLSRGTGTLQEWLALHHGRPLGTTSIVAADDAAVFYAYHTGGTSRSLLRARPRMDYGRRGVVMRSAQQYPLVRDGNIYYRDLTGHSFGRLYVLDRVVRRKGKDGRNLHWWRCRCACGKICKVDIEPLVCGHTQSCGCLSKQGHVGICPVFRTIVIDHRTNTTKSTAEIGRYFGITKNSVIGILDRAGMCEKQEPEPLTMAQRLDQYIFPMVRHCAYPHGIPWEPGLHWCSV